jgi:hypothetical protein
MEIPDANQSGEYVIGSVGSNNEMALLGPLPVSPFREGEGATKK